MGNLVTDKHGLSETIACIRNVGVKVEMVIKSHQESPMQALGEGYARVQQAAEFLSLSRAKVYQLMESGELAYCKFGKSRRIPIEALREYTKRCLVQAG